ncbi:hypothetical protein ACPV5S_20085 [Vibrio astriarenae]
MHYLKLIEALLMTEGKINAPMFCDVFGCGRQWASKKFSEYQKKAPGKMTYTPAGPGSAYYAHPDFKPVFLKSDPRAYIKACKVVFDQG